MVELILTLTQLFLLSPLPYKTPVGRQRRRHMLSSLKRLTSSFYS